MPGGSRLYAVDIAAQDHGHEYHTVLHYAGAFDDRNAQDLAQHFSGSITDGLKATLTSTGHLVAITARGIPPHGSGIVPEEYTQAVSIAGTYTGLSGTNVPYELCGLVKKKTNAALRGAHGWVYGFPITASNAIDNTSPDRIDTSGPYWTGLQALAAVMDNTVIGSNDTYEPVVFSHARWLREDPTYWFGITSGVADARLRWLRRRAPERG